jgi:AcrR family transcriptional regulator
MSKGNLYSHFSNKKELYNKVVEYVVTYYVIRISNELRKCVSNENKLDVFVNTVYEISMEKKEYLKLLINELGTYCEEAPISFIDLQKILKEILSVNSTDNRRINSSNTERLCFAFLTQIFGLIHITAILNTKKTHLETDEILKNYIAIVKKQVSVYFIAI